MTPTQFFESGGWNPPHTGRERRFDWRRWYRPCPKCGMELGRYKGSFDRTPLHKCGAGGRRWKEEA
jgi:hypothetical protein